MSTPWVEPTEERFWSPVVRAARVAVLVADGYREAPADGHPLRPGFFRPFERLGSYYLRIAGVTAKDAVRGARTRAVWASRSPEQRAAIGRKISASRQGQLRSAVAKERTKESLRQTWAGKTPEQRRAQTAPAVEAARRIDKERRREICIRASTAARGATAGERSRRARKAAATRRSNGNERKALERAAEGSRAWWSRLTTEERSAESRRRALLRWARVRAERTQP